MKVITVTKGDHTQSYDITAGFQPPGEEVYPQITDADFAALDDGDYVVFRAAFLRYVCSQEPGLAADCPDLADGSTVFNPTLCPLTVQTNQTNI